MTDISFYASDPNTVSQKMFFKNEDGWSVDSSSSDAISMSQAKDDYELEDMVAAHIAWAVYNCHRDHDPAFIGVTVEEAILDATVADLESMVEHFKEKINELNN